ncbi:Hsp20/alpha crystallin family protein [Candidatus Geothermarchaeota archaeon]|nr:MAG: Hsp20/alpha crystallin family protein [Candidatus Geothermarchaeota archaeon]
MGFWWERRRRRSIWDWFFRDIEEMFEDLMEEFKEITEFEKEKPVKSYIYGFTFSIGPDGKPVFREFGNVKPGFIKPKITAEREPLVETYEEGDEIVVLAELPGVEKEDIKLNLSENALEIKVDTEKRKYYKMLELPKPVSTENVKTSYKNGILEVRLKKKEEKRWKTLKIE